MSEMTMEQVDLVLRTGLVAVSEVRPLAALARRALEQAARDKVNDAFLAKVDAALEQPVPAGEVTRPGDSDANT